jgi:hypothetical protein
MKVVFLDIDGVLINMESCAAGSGIPHPSCVAALNSLTDRGNAFIVVSSGWRLGRTVIMLREMLKGWGVTGTVLGATPDLDTYRGSEIRKWLDDWCSRYGHEVESFVILDDVADMGDLMSNLVLIDYRTGLTPELVEQALRVLCIPRELRV